ncbi:MAG: type II toxin-antitoxin system Phd/YefM family antitoxin [Rhodospirillales bacterium]|nr:type II toxin-antitoxin system Phd/YefM family antitoxin [Rhodospirillales bacterium]MCB9973155.1 type II toxin-antitoxin system Phd/YefM family antitoxin [Rhodospirillales bacterium]MCB9980147.1 type II toxin-antitoxin system Phd/YefM family antitoxin [Rhodospirillales bacterium]
MFTIDQIRPVSDFSRKPAEHIKRLKETGLPEVLTVNGRAELVIQDAQAYEEMASLIYSLRQIVIAKQQHDRGEATSADEAFTRLSEKLAAKYPHAGF